MNQETNQELDPNEKYNQDCDLAKFWLQFILKLNQQSSDFISLREDVDRLRDMTAEIKTIVADNPLAWDQYIKIEALIRNYDVADDDTIKVYFD